GEAAERVRRPVRGGVSRMKGQPSDNAYGCPTEALVPSVAVGRFPARSKQECEAMVAKTLALEQDRRPGAWRRQMGVLAGMPAYGAVVDSLVEGLAMSRFDAIDPSWSGQVVYYNPTSRFCVPDAELHDRALKLAQHEQ